MREHVVPGRGLTNEFVDKFCRLACGRNFRGVYPRNLLVPLALSGLPRHGRFSIIINLGDELLEREGHFVAVVAEPERVHYFDPFGMAPPSSLPRLHKFLSACRRPVRFNPTQVQDLDSAYCALFAALFVLHRDRGSPFPLKFWPPRSGRLRDNDLECVRQLRRLLGA